MSARLVIEELRELAALTSTPEGAQRLAWGPVWREARAWFAGKVRALGLEPTRDAAGNVWVTLPGESDRTVILGGHLDSVPNGGWLDGALGVLASFEALRRHAAAGRPAVTLRLVDWADEEGARFGRSLLGSSAASGTLDIEAVRNLEDTQGTRLVDALAENGVALERMQEAHAALLALDAKAYLELHIEQGPVLESLGRPTGVVLGTFGVERHRLRFTGQAAHSGSTPVPMRHDAFLAAAETALACRDLALRHSTPGAGVVCTVGMVRVEPGIVTAVPGVCEISLDQRALDAAVLARLLGEAREASARVGDRYPPPTPPLPPRRVGRVGAAVAHRAEAIRSGPGAPVRGGGARGDRRCAAVAVRPAARCRRDGAAHADRHDVRALGPGLVALQGGRHPGALPRADDRRLSTSRGQDSGPRMKVPATSQHEDPHAR
jgi:allantoate deiminase